MNIVELKEKNISELTQMAKRFKIDGAAGMRKQELMFALLQHQTKTQGVAADKPSADFIHWDLLIEVPDQSLLATWRLTDNPLLINTPVVAERIQDHRRIYLEYEGPLTRNRGFVHHLDHGPANIIKLVGDELHVMLEGAQLRGQFRIRRDKAGSLLFSRIAVSDHE